MVPNAMVTNSDESHSDDEHKKEETRNQNSEIEKTDLRLGTEPPLPSNLESPPRRSEIIFETSNDEQLVNSAAKFNTNQVLSFDNFKTKRIGSAANENLKATKVAG